jgi:MerR family transcriptional regulator, light-induced transcriptional regulator
VESRSSSDFIDTLRQDYLRALMGGSGRAADLVVEAALDAAIAPQRIYLEIFQPTAYEIGRLWQTNQVSVAQEHLATAIIERQMGELHPYFKGRPGPRRTIVLGCVPDEWHSIGARMVADFFEAEGWQVHYLGANVPVRDLVGLARESSADMVGLSAEMLFNLPRVGELVRALDTAGLGGIPVIAGGMPFIEQPDLWAALSLHGSAGDAAAAVATARKVLGSGQPQLRAEPAAAAALRAQREAVVAEATRRCLVAGDSDRALVSAGLTFVTKMLEAALAAGTPDMLVSQAAWANERQPHDGVAPEQMLARMSLLGEALSALLPVTEGEQAVAYLNHLMALMAGQSESVAR